MHARTILVLIAAFTLNVLIGGCSTMRQKSPNVQTRQIDYTVEGTRCRGLLAWDANADGKRPGVLVCHEWWGNNEYAAMRARKLAEIGYVAFALDVYGEGKTTSDPKQAGEWAGEASGKLRTRAGAGLDVLKKQPEVDVGRLAAIGYCMGGTTALEAARSGVGGDALKAIVCFHTSNLTASNPSDNRNIKGQVLVCHGDADQFVKPDMIPNFEKQMRDAGILYSIERYPGAVHAFTNPDADKYNLPSVGYNKEADERSWNSMKELFSRTIDKH